MGVGQSAFSDCDFEQEIHLPGQEHWMIHQASTKDGSQVSVFVYGKNDNKYDQYVINYQKLLKTLKHPAIIKFLAYIENTDEKWIVTERLSPLETVIDTLSPTEICAGLYSIIEALAFLHDRGSICHNNVCQTSIFVAQDGSWKLGGLEYACKFTEASSANLAKTTNLRFQGALAPEEKAGRVDTSARCGHSRDAFAFGVLAEVLMEYLSPLGAKASTFESSIRDCFLDPAPQNRPRLATLLSDKLFKDDYVSILNFLKNLTIKTELDKKLFFSTVAEKLYLLPEETVATRLVHPILSRFVLLDPTACEHLIPHLLTPCTVRKPSFESDEINPLLTEASFRKHVLPEIYKIFHVRDAHIRTVLLRHFADYVHLFSKATLTQIFPQILLGLRDNNDLLVSMTLHAVAELVPILGGDIVIGAKRNKIFIEGSPNFKREGDIPNSVGASEARQNGPISGLAVSSQKREADAAKQAEKERRKEEMRRKREERKKKRDEKVKAQKLENVMINGETKETDSTAQEEDGYPADRTDQSPDRSDNKDRSEVNQSEQAKEESRSEDEDVDISDIDQDIEDELSAMDSTLSSEEQQRVNRTVTEDFGPPVQVDWSDVSSTANTPSSVSSKSGKGALRLQKGKAEGNKAPEGKTLTSPAPKSKVSLALDIDEDNNQDIEDWTEDNWDENTWETNNSPSPKKSPRSSKSPKREASFPKTAEVPGEKPTSARTALTKTKGSAPKVQDFDLDSLDIKTSKGASNPTTEPEEFDFFADMQPELKPQGDSLLSILKGDIPESKSSKTTKAVEAEKKSAISFAVTDTAEADPGGWGDEADWDIEDEDMS